MIKIFSFLFILLSLTSCFNWKNEEVKSEVQNLEPNITKTETWSISTWEIIPINEKTTQAEKEFSNDLNNLLNLVDEKWN